MDGWEGLIFKNIIEKQQTIKEKVDKFVYSKI